MPRTLRDWMILIAGVAVPLGLAPNKGAMAAVLVCLTVYYFGLIVVGYLIEQSFLGRLLGTGVLVLLALLIVPVVIMAVIAFLPRAPDF